MIKLIFLILVLSIIPILITYFLSKLNNRIYKFIPSFVLFIISLYFGIQLIFFSSGMEILGFLLFFKTFGVLFLITLIFAFMIKGKK